ncbi:MAG: B12-binding domain-containing radical SAM protein [Stellaceae bacterium]
MTSHCRVLLICPRFSGQSFWNFTAACEVYGARFPAAPLGLITVAALLPDSWQCRLVNRNTEELAAADLDWADLVMTGGMLPQRPDTQAVIALAQQHGKPVVVGGPDATSSPEAYSAADFRVLGEAEGVIDAFIAAWDAGARQGLFEADKFTIDVTRTPIPRYDLLRRSHYVYYGVQFSRGCPFTCEFCDIIELYGRVPRVKTVAQILAELEALYHLGYRGHLDFVDDNFIGNKKAVKALLPHVIAWQKERGYPFEFSTEASINLADDDALLALMRAANFFAVFIGIESPDADTLVSTRKKQNTRRVLAACVHRIYRAGMFVTAGFIVGFDSERDSVADSMAACIEDTAIPACMVGLLYALSNTQLTRRLAREGRLFASSSVISGDLELGDQCTRGLNFHTTRPRREVLADYRKILQRIYRPAAYYARLQAMVAMLDRPLLDKRRAPRRGRIAGVPLHDLVLLWRLTWRIAVRQPRAFRHFGRTLYRCARDNPRALGYVGMLASLFLHFGPFSRFVITELDRQIAKIDAGEWRPPDVTSPDVTQARSVSPEEVPRSESGRSPAAVEKLPGMAPGERSG